MRTHLTSDAARLAAVFTCLLLVASVPVALAVDASGLREAASLRAQDESLEARADAATVELYALEAELRQARQAVESIATRRASVERDRASARKQLEIARNALRVSEAQLAELARALYEDSASSDPLAILLGSASLEEALTGLDSLSRSAEATRGIIEQARSSRGRLARLEARLAARHAELAELGAAAAARAGALERAGATRERFVASLRRQQGLNAALIATIEAQARTAGARTTAIAASPARATPPAGDVAPVATSGSTITVSSTGYALRGRTATGVPTAPGVVAVDPSVIPLGTRMTIPGYGEGIAADTGGAVRGNTIDLWFPSIAQALAWGRRTVTITLS